MQFMRYFIVIYLFFEESLARKEKLNTHKFPDTFKFGAATASYQVEGGWNADDKGENIWDHACHTKPYLIKNNANGDVACDSYHKFKEDVALLKELGVNFYRFSLSWSRILPNGNNKKISQAGISYYKKLIRELLDNKIEPLVTIFHWDTPQVIEEAGGWLDEHIVDFYADYARICFEHFGNDVKHWLTFNEPKQTCQGGYGTAEFAPFINSSGIGEYKCAHNLLKAHARVWHMYDKEFRRIQKGFVGIAIDSNWFEPASSDTKDIRAAERMIQFSYGWYAHPIFVGDYPREMRQNIDRRSIAEGFKKSRLPYFTKQEIAYVNGTYDFLGVNMYTSSLVKAIDDPPKEIGSFADAEVFVWQPDDWESSASDWLKVTPWGARKLLRWIRKSYGNIQITITENGISDKGILVDDQRIRYYQTYLSSIHDAMESDDVNVTAYTAWSFMDNFEWGNGYTEKFGLYHVDFNSPNRTRTKKKSVNWYQRLIKSKCIVDECH